MSTIKSRLSRTIDKLKSKLNVIGSRYNNLPDSVRIGLINATGATAAGIGIGTGIRHLYHNQYPATSDSVAILADSYPQDIDEAPMETDSSVKTATDTVTTETPLPQSSQQNTTVSSRRFLGKTRDALSAFKNKTTYNQRMMALAGGIGLVDGLAGFTVGELQKLFNKTSNVSNGGNTMSVLNGLSINTVLMLFEKFAVDGLVSQPDTEIVPAVPTATATPETPAIPSATKATPREILRARLRNTVEAIKNRFGTLSPQKQNAIKMTGAGGLGFGLGVLGNEIL